MPRDKSAIRSVIGGHTAVRIGKDFEAAMEITHKAYEDHGLARIKKLPVPTTYCGNGMRRLCATQTWDYEGSFGPNAGPSGNEGMYYGTMVAMEAKASKVAKPSMPISSSTHSGGGISYHQLEALANAGRDWGVVAAIAWMNGEDLLVLLPDQVLAAKAMYDRGDRKSIPKSMFKTAEIAGYPQHPHVFDWLYEVRCWLENNGLPSSSSSKRRIYDMVKFGLDISRKKIKVANASNEGMREFDTEITDRTFLEQLARESTSPEDFEDRVKNARNANESDQRGAAASARGDVQLQHEPSVPCGDSDQAGRETSPL